MANMWTIGLEIIKHDIDAEKASCSHLLSRVW